MRLTDLAVCIVSGKAVGILDVALQADHGTLSINSRSLVFQQDQQGLVEFAGTLADIDRALATLVYRPDPGYVGPDELQIEVVDPGSTPDVLDTVTAFEVVSITMY